jgi:hypothetical protein
MPNKAPVCDKSSASGKSASIISGWRMPRLGLGLGLGLCLGLGFGCGLGLELGVELGIRMGLSNAVKAAKLKIR